MNLWVIIPECILLVWAFLLATVWKERQDLAEPSGLLRACSGAMIAVIALGVAGFGGINTLFFNDTMGLFFKFAILAILVFSLFVMGGTQTWRGKDLSLLYLATFGCMIVAGANELATLFIGLNIATLSLWTFYWLVSSDERDRAVVRRWFAFAVTAGATLAFGMSLIYGLSASTQLVQSKINLAIVHLTRENIGVILAIAEVLLLVGVAGVLLAPPLAGKLSAESSDRIHPGVTVYRIAIMTTLGILLFAKIFDNNLSAFQGTEMNPNDWGILATVFASAAMILGAVFALKSTDLMSVVVWLTMSQIGGVWQAWIWLTEDGIVTAGFCYAALLIALFAVTSVIAIVRGSSADVDADSFAGLWHRSPLLGAIAIAGLVSMAGMPATVGYNARLLWFESGIVAIGRESLGLWGYVAVASGAVGTLVSLVAIFPWVKRIVVSSAQASPVEWRGAQRVVALVMVLAIVLLGLFASPLYQAVSGLPIAFGFLQR
ncbi:MAG: proton-conducting transporter membrane subunit [Candidatus Zixiibacteriota bacterium]